MTMDCHVATRSIHDELLPMVRALGAKKVLRTLHRSLHLKTSEVIAS